MTEGPTASGRLLELGEADKRKESAGGSVPVSRKRDLASLYACLLVLCANAGATGPNQAAMLLATTTPTQNQDGVFARQVRLSRTPPGIPVIGKNSGGGGFFFIPGPRSDGSPSNLNECHASLAVNDVHHRSVSQSVRLSAVPREAQGQAHRHRGTAGQDTMECRASRQVPPKSPLNGLAWRTQFPIPFQCADPQHFSAAVRSQQAARKLKGMKRKRQPREGKKKKKPTPPPRLTLRRPLLLASPEYPIIPDCKTQLPPSCRL